MKLEVTTEELKKYKIMIGTPMYGGQCTGIYCKSIADLTTLCASNGIDLEFNFLYNESLIQRARNYIVDGFLRSDCTHLMFIDADIGFFAKDVLALLGLQISYPEKYDILTGPYPKKIIDWNQVKEAVKSGRADTNANQLQFFISKFVFNKIEKDKGFRIDEPVEIAEGGTGFMLIPREVFVKYDENYPELSYKPDHIGTEHFDGSREITAYFDCKIDPESKRYLSEDYFFCINSRKIGIKVHMCPWMEIRHVGSYTFKGSMPAQASLEMSQKQQKNPKKERKSKKKRK